MIGGLKDGVKVYYWEDGSWYTEKEAIIIGDRYIDLMDASGVIDVWDGCDEEDIEKIVNVALDK